MENEILLETKELLQRLKQWKSLTQLQVRIQLLHFLLW
mgnify:CR=1 FL=1